MRSPNERHTALLARLGLRIPSVLLPRDGVDLHRWAVVACDQYTSDHAYWSAVETAVGDAPSTLRLMLPEIFLESADVQTRIARIHQTMAAYLAQGVFTDHGACLILVRRTPHHGPSDRAREGLVVALDLERYDYARDSKTLIRATEGTIVERIPPRLAVRRAASLELPHIMVLIDDPDRSVVEAASAKVTSGAPLYDVELMQGGGRLQGWKIADDDGLTSVLTALDGLLTRTMSAQKTDQPLFFAMGDGNHSFATAKTRWEETKRELKDGGADTDTILAHPARFALAEIVNVHSPGLSFEPIHRVIFTENPAAVVPALRSSKQVSRVSQTSESELRALLEGPAGQQIAGVFDGQGYFAIEFTGSALPTAQVDQFFASYRQQASEARIDFIHGWEDTRRLSEGTDPAAPKAVSFFTPVIARERLFSWVQENGPLPRKSFSMGHAEEKRFYMEARRITP